MTRLDSCRVTWLYFVGQHSHKGLPRFNGRDTDLPLDEKRVKDFTDVFYSSGKMCLTHLTVLGFFAILAGV